MQKPPFRDLDQVAKLKAQAELLKRPKAKRNPPADDTPVRPGPSEYRGT